LIAEEYNPGGDRVGVTACHNGYRRLGIVHQRTVMAPSNGHWIIRDDITGKPTEKVHTARLQWLLPDWKFELQNPVSETQSPEFEIHLYPPPGRITLKVHVNCPKQNAEKNSKCNICWSLIRGGERIAGNGSTHSTWGWVSPTYGKKIPALSFIVEVSDLLPIVFQSAWILPA
jgi:hypothetical protein